MDKNTLRQLKQGYIELLMISDNITRASLNDTYCLLRDTIAAYTGLSSQEVQEECEEKAYHIKHNNF